MNESDLPVFAELFKKAVARCFSSIPDRPLTESECRQLSLEIEEQTGLVIGWKSLKNYAAFVLGAPTQPSVNPSVASLDTLARYVSMAPASSETQRKKQIAPYKYWFRYREVFQGHPLAVTRKPGPRRKWLYRLAWPVVLGAAVLARIYFASLAPERVAEDFHSVEASYLQRQGWWWQAPEQDHWQKRGEKAGQLTLFTLAGDNWPRTGQPPVIRNLLLRKISDDCFRTEVQFSEFLPTQNWQQAGLILLEDTAFAGKSIRLSLAYNDYFGGYTRPGEIIIQGIASYGKSYSNLEEIVHHPLFTLGGAAENRIVADNLKSTAVRIEKQGHTFRFLYSASPLENSSYKELAAYTFDMEPRFVGIFALKGFVDSTSVLPVGVKFFRLEGQSCR